jgi:hypothetical protein
MALPMSSSLLGQGRSSALPRRKAASGVVRRIDDLRMGLKRGDGRAASTATGMGTAAAAAADQRASPQPFGFGFGLR